MKNEKNMITILEFSVTEERDIRPGYPEPDMCGTGWHCSICGEKVSSSHRNHRKRGLF